jgi:outer membrane lipoprotein-sorting protein
VAFEVLHSISAKCSKLLTFEESARVILSQRSSSMKPQIRSARFTLSFLISLGVAQAAAAQPSDPPAANPQSRMSVEEIVTNLVQRNLERARALGAYQGTRVYRLEYHGFPGSRSAEMTVDVKYRTPGTKEFSIRSEKGSQLIIERVFKRMLQSEKEAVSAENQSRIALNNDNYRFALAGYESAPAGSSYILSVEPRTNNKLLYRGRIWVDTEDFAVVRIEAAPAKNPSFWTKETRIEQVYTKVGDFWLPASNRSSSAIRLGGQANFTIDYHDYQITAASPVGAPGKVAGYR